MKVTWGRILSSCEKKPLLENARVIQFMSIPCPNFDDIVDVCSGMFWFVHGAMLILNCLFLLPM